MPHPITSRHAHALRTPAVLATLLAATLLAGIPEASAAVSGPETQSRHQAGAQVGGQTQPAQSLPPYRVVRGVHLRLKPPPYRLPVAGYHLTGRFGASSSLWSSTHTGLDFAAGEGTEIRAVASGVVTSVGYDGAYGNKTEVRLADGTVLWFCHQSGTEVSAGERVAAGQLIGYVGSTGNVTGPHLHLEVHPAGGDPVDPDAWLVDHGLHP
jgi:murein DD-endopeptidase MepM/ murein hydrolase activator NlpD